jgi:hypothetical protein
MTHPEAPTAPPLKGRHQRPGKAGSAVAPVKANGDQQTSF